MVEILNEYHKAGRIGAFGGSNWTHQRIAEANQYAGEHGLIPFTVSSPNFGLCDQIGDPWGGGPGMCDDFRSVECGSAGMVS